MTAMISGSTKAPVRLGEYVPTADSRILMNGVDWEGYEALLALRGERRWPRMAYLDGVVELMGTSRGHETIKSNIGCLIEGFCFERDVPFSPYGSWHQKARAKKAGAEPDECYIFSATPKQKDKPDLVIEVIWTSGGIDKLEIYRRLQIGEVWFWEEDDIQVYVLGAKGYQRRTRSACLPELDLALLARLAQIEPTSEAVKQLRQALRAG
jgi:Uma2 family endonuclease